MVIAHDGGTPEQMCEWLGDLNFTRQGKGDLGERIRRVIEAEQDQGADAVLVLGADCPELNERVIDSAIIALAKASLVFGPAEDGGYYLIGVTSGAPDVLSHMAWGTGDVLSKSLKRARSLGCTPALLETLRDVDEPEDLPAAKLAIELGKTVSVIVPVLNEAERLPSVLPKIWNGCPLEIIVADGGSQDGSSDIARELGAKVIETGPGRSKQMNAAAAVAKGEFLLFLHADTEPPRGFVKLIGDTLRQSGIAAGAFSFALDSELKLKDAIERLVAWRCRRLQLPYGDQALFVRRALFNAIGKFPDLPVLEDFELVRALKQLGRVETLPSKAITSARRWREGGVLRTFAKHQIILLSHFIRIRKQKLCNWRDNGRITPPRSYNDLSSTAWHGTAPKKGNGPVEDVFGDRQSAPTSIR